LADKLSDICRKPCSTVQAAEVMRCFFERFPGVRKFTEQVYHLCKEKGYVQTICRRRRYLGEISSGDSQLRSSAQRQAVNTIIQVQNLIAGFVDFSFRDLQVML
jgi:DNA polymerase I-like protein with 3'-5' exonuclease and polymerase domains